MPSSADSVDVFLNIPYDKKFSSLYVAFVYGICRLGMTPRIAAEVPGGIRRLDRILRLIQSCRFSIHDLSRVEVKVEPNAVPRFNMPLELGMAITWQELNPSLHTWFVWEAEPYRILASASDLNGSDPTLHGGTPEGVLRGLCADFWRQEMPSFPEVLIGYRSIRGQLNDVLKKCGTRNPYERSVFLELRWLSLSLVHSL